MNEPDEGSHWSFPRFWAVGLIALLMGTWRLWLPTAAPDYPRVPWLDIPERWSVSICWVAVVVLVAALIVLACLLSRWRRPAWWLVTVSLAALFLMDQHALQPWAYQSAIYALVFATMKPPAAKRCLIPLAASVYIYSAAGKLDFQFAHTVGQDFLAMVLAPVGGLRDAWSETLRCRVALAMPISELCIGIGLLVRWTRRIAAFAAIGMHVTLISILGPWALGHSLGVLLWNVVLIGQAWFLFIKPSMPIPSASDQAKPKGIRTVVAGLAKAVVVTAIAMPLLERPGYWDHWLSWSLYSPHTSRVEAELHRTELEKLPESIRRHAADDVDGDGWHRFAIGDWSLRDRGVPIYPQARYQLELVKQTCERYEIDGGVRVIVKGVADRWTGKRSTERLLGIDEIRGRESSR